MFTVVDKWSVTWRKHLMNLVKLVALPIEYFGKELPLNWKNKIICITMITIRSSSRHTFDQALCDLHAWLKIFSFQIRVFQTIFVFYLTLLEYSLSIQRIENYIHYKYNEIFFIDSKWRFFAYDSFRNRIKPILIHCSIYRLLI